MAEIVFYQKRGCATNARQIRALETAGHSVIVRDLLNEPWTAAGLRGFFGALPISSWFNPAAPKIKTGEIDPIKFDEPSALSLLMAEPILIRRPQIETDGKRCVGFDNETVDALLAGPKTKIDERCARANRVSDLATAQS